MPSSNFTDCLLLMFRQSSLCFANLFSLLKHCKQLLQNHFFFFISCFVKHKSVKIFNIHVMWLIIIIQKQQIHRVLKFLVRNINWKNQLIFITKHVNSYILFHLNLAKIFFLHRTLNSNIIKCFSNFFVSFLILSGCSFEGLICLTWHHKKHFWSLLLMLISPFLGLLSPYKNFLIMVYKLKY